ncbi:hypothetical protein [Chitinophaga sp. Cy-1792]|uniref:hypothetical protein n=1 Tax=Chitinophaga sp. Cy-1792 TaxID=2608339 RepID=UPI00141FC956|nr:hypothetical protein [Chitinophaga sp. Cy-1792]NIG54417.1 hypothetical protein [Chitinophaga sp. Cy-1792]
MAFYKASLLILLIFLFSCKAQRIHYTFTPGIIRPVVPDKLYTNGRGHIYFVKDTAFYEFLIPDKTSFFAGFDTLFRVAGTDTMRGKIVAIVDKTASLDIWFPYGRKPGVIYQLKPAGEKQRFNWEHYRKYQFYNDFSREDESKDRYWVNKEMREVAAFADSMSQLEYYNLVAAKRRAIDIFLGKYKQP